MNGLCAIISTNKLEDSLSHSKRILLHQQVVDINIQSKLMSLSSRFRFLIHLIKININWLVIWICL